MSSRLPKHLFDALTAVRLAQEFSAGLSFDAFVSNVLVRSAIERQFLPALAQSLTQELAKQPAP